MCRGEYFESDSAKVKTYNVLVTAVGAIIGYGIVRALKAGRYSVRVVGMDVFADAVGRQWCDDFIESVPAVDPDYPGFLLEVMRRFDIDLVCFGVEQEVLRVMFERQVFGDKFAKMVMNAEQLVTLSQDKWRMHEYLQTQGFPVIPSRISGSYNDAVAELGSPFLLKPRCSTASKGICEIQSSEDYEYWRRKTAEDFMVQRIVGSIESEYTVGAFGLGDGSISQSVTFVRKLGRDGSTVKAATIENENIDQCVMELCHLFKPVGPTNFQFREHEGEFLLLEINPRFSSSLSLRAAFGFNEPEMCIEYFIEGKKPEVARLSKGKAARYIEDVVEFS
ncbi:MAG: carbamoyl-phosphate synthase subunit L [Desulfuromonas sp.]|nr:MAG: carbamoyl-phosphate synthase subunit L [Desulfuromonas sp.]